MSKSNEIYSDDDENNNINNNNENQSKIKKHSPLQQSSSESGTAQDISIITILSGSFAVACMIYSLHATSILIKFLSGNAFGILPGTAISKDDCWTTLVLNDLLLLSLFIFQHKFMASEFYKHYISKVVPEHFHRSIYILFTGFVIKIMKNYWVSSLSNTSVMFWDWSEYNTVVLLCQILHFFAWIHTFAVVFMLDFSEFMGLKQVYYKVNNFGCPMSGKTEEAQRFFRHFRHVTVSGLMIIFWLVPCLTVDRFLLATVFTVFLFSTRIDVQDYEYAKKMYRLKKVAIKYHVSP